MYDILHLINKENFISMGDFNFGNSIDWKNNVSHGRGKFFFKCIVQILFNAAC